MVKVNLGCGCHPMEGWLNYDLVDHPGVIRRDLTFPLPHKDNSVDFVFSEHFIEHITRAHALSLLIECRRILKPGGSIRISTPDLVTLLCDYVVNKIDRWENVWRPKTPCQMVNEGMRLWGHEFLYDRDEMELILKEAGFVDIKPVTYRHSDIDELKGLEIRPFHIELIMEATK